MGKVQLNVELPLLQPIATSESSTQSNQTCNKTGEENLRNIVLILVCQTAR